ncbi:MAG: hypothetical protein K6E33_03605 [Lachnospiraceae bacterium]|nr:hypothetical protein [Lachnospiraceae bacterium]
MNISRKLKPGILEFLAFEFFCLIIALSFYRYYSLSKLLEAGLLVFCALICFFEKDRRSAMQNSVLMFIFSAIWFGAIFSPAVYNGEHPKFVAAGAIALTAGLISSLARSRSGEILKAIKNCPGVFLIMALFILFSIPSLTELPILDSGAYYGWMRQIVSQFDYTFKEMPYYCFYDHLSPGYALFVLMGELWAGQTGAGLHAVNLILFTLSIPAFYSLTGMMSEHTGRLMRCLLTSCYAAMPSFLGLSGNISLDIPLIPLSVIMIWAFMSENDILFAFFSWVFILTKEPALIYFCIMCLGILIFEIKEQNLVPFLKSRAIAFSSGVLSVIWWLVYYLAPGRGAYGMAGELFITEGEDMHGFGFTLSNLTGKAAQFFILDFNWVILIILVISAALILTNKTALPGKASELVFISSFLCAGVMLFNIFYIDYMHPRYIFVFEAPFLIMSLTLFSNVPFMSSLREDRGKGTSAPGNRRKLIYLLPALLTLLLFVQSFCCIDILTRVLVFHEPVGLSAPFSAFGDGKVFNRESSYPVKAVEKALRESGCTRDDRIAVQGLYLTGSEYSDGRIIYSKDGKNFVDDSENADIIIVMPWKETGEDLSKVKKTSYGTVTVGYYRNQG